MTGVALKQGPYGGVSALNDGGAGRIACWVDGFPIGEQNKRKIDDNGATFKMDSFACDLFWGGAPPDWNTVTEQYMDIGRIIVEVD